MTAYLRSSTPAVATPRATRNHVSLDQGDLLVIVEVDATGSYLAFHDAEEIKPWIAVLEEALALASEGQAILSQRAADKAAAESQPPATAEAIDALAKHNAETAAETPASES